MPLRDSLRAKIRIGLPYVLFILVYGFASTLYAQKFVPQDGKCLVFVGQDLAATGGLDTYDQGYSDYFDIPAGVTVYTNLSPGSESYGHYNKGLDGIKTKANWGAGDSWANLYVEDATYTNSAIAIGLSMVNHEKRISKGEHDGLIRELGVWIQSIKRPVFLRIGYEFDGWEWNHYRRKHYLKAWKRIHSIFEALKVDNVAFVWQSKGTGSDQDVLEAWYPGDDLVDWCAYSYFGQPDEEMIVFARRHHKPVFIAEATPVRQSDNLYFDTDLKKERLEQTIWQEWFVPFFRTLEKNNDVIKAFSYINSDWSSQPMWITNPVFQKVDSRIQVSEYISRQWREEMKKPQYLHATKGLWNGLSKD
ncbi:1,4-beta-xylanase [Muricauda sp. SCSIO 64092]|uniref:1,4-beta-xylanase n=1 Tax=Allomuricauda sp. SCSIO 64092 TaxID=2908842 RepID=UPI001FF5C537|nr:1,4-beta-xylanase [Muricauda sp. SCSIO 64092]UOY06870.1 1,4-beta-xylanase [Muricauda sp. SCSIO 64092]